MNKVIDFPHADFEDLSLSQRRILIEEWNTEMRDNLDMLRDTAAKIAELIEANNRLVSQ